MSYTILFVTAARIFLYPIVKSQIANPKIAAIPNVLINPCTSPLAISTSTALWLSVGIIATMSVSTTIMIIAMAVWNL